MPFIELDKKSIDSFKVDVGDFLFARSGAIGRFGIVTKSIPCVFASYIIRFKLNENFLLNDFLRFFLQTISTLKQFNMIKQGSSNININAENIKSMKVILPTIPTEQQKIVSILSNVDNLIQNTDKTIQQTRRLKKSLMQKLLTKGIGHTKFKKVPWLFRKEIEIPEEWEVGRCSEICELKNGYAFKNSDFFEKETGMKIIKIGNLKQDRNLDIENCDLIALERKSEFLKNIINTGDVLMALTGATLGKVSVIKNDYSNILQNYRVGKFIPTENKILNTFMSHLLRTNIIQSNIFRFVNQGAQPNVGKADFKLMFIPVPKIDESIVELSIKPADVSSSTFGKLDNFCRLK